MERQVITYNTIEGLHMWPDAPVSVAHLRNQHRHVFVIRCWWEVSHNEREIEIQMMQHVVEGFILNKMGGNYPVDFGDMSCESIAELILERFEQCVKCEVLEDGYGGAALSR